MPSLDTRCPPTGRCPKGLRYSPVAFTCETSVSLETSVILSASRASSAMFVFSDKAKIRRTSGGSCARKSALNKVAGSAFRFCMC